LTKEPGLLEQLEGESLYRKGLKFEPTACFLRALWAWAWELSEPELLGDGSRRSVVSWGDRVLRRGGEAGEANLRELSS